MYLECTIEKAIEIMELNLREAGSKMHPDCKTAVSLSIEALRGIQEIRDNYPEIPIALLPSETKE